MIKDGCDRLDFPPLFLNMTDYFILKVD